ncbi:MAG: sulfurtransferase [Kineosporiaceae bacterium]|jgi:thiosulfate/3-mercaptopyruvate sulfurtransferase
MDVLIDVARVAGLLGTPGLVLLDVRWALGDPHGHAQYLSGHVPGAVFVDLDRDLAAPPSPAHGRHPLPALSDLQASARRWGITSRSRVVVYDDSAAMAAARAWWLLRWAGLTQVEIMDGGLEAWRAARLPLEPGKVTPGPGDVVLDPGHLPVLDADGAARLAAGDGVLLDARAGERYRGEVEPIDPKAGHIPGAVGAPTADNLGPQGRFLPGPGLRQRFAALGVDDRTEAGVYCGSGVTAAHQVAALAVAGFEAALYPGSWSQWSNDPARPVATG